ncbi:MAG: histidine kinase [Bacteroidia bacterium]|nr:histidine kinase [Bacteroidia bacterium]
MLKIQLILFLVVAPLLILRAQHPYSYSLNEENGLPSNETYCLRQDSMGYIWMGCNAGLYRYNGVTYKSYSNPAMNSKAISGLRFDQAGKIWCYNFTGQIFFVRNDSLILFKDYSKICKTYPRFAFDKNGNVWVTADEVIEVLTREGKLVQSFNKLKNNKGIPISWGEIECNERGVLFVHAINGGLWQIKGNNPGELELISDTTQSNLINNRGAFRFLRKHLYFINEINPDRKYILWKVDENKLQFTAEIKLPQSNDIIYSICLNHRNEILLLTSDGVFPADNRYNFLEKQKFFANEKISDLLIDREGSYWFSSLQNGIMVIPSIDLNILNSKNSTIPDDNISTLKFISPSELILGTYKGELYRFLTKNGNTQLYMNNGNSIYRHVRKIKNYRGITYIARGAFSIFNQNKERFFRIWNARDFDFMNDSIYLVLSDQVVRVYRNEMSENPPYNVIRPKGGSAIFCDTVSQVVYFACNDGFFRFQSGHTTEIKFKSKPVYASSLQAINGKLWIATISDGVFVYNLTTGQTEENLTVQNGLCSNTIRTMQVTTKGVWLITEKCLAYYDNNAKLHTYGFAEGLLAKQINAIDVVNDTAWIATNKGLIRMPVTMQSENTIKPGVSITGFLVNDTPYPLFYSTKLSWNHHDIQLSFEGIALRSRGNFQYKYRLIGNDTVWAYALPGNNSVRYNNLTPGKYRFEVMCINEDGLAGPPATFSFEIAKPYWQQWWFGVISVFFIGGITLLIFNLRIKLLKRRADEQNKLILSQLTALKAQMNPHFMYNTLNSIQDLIVQQDIKSTNYYLSQFGSLMRKVLDASGNEQILLSEEIEILHLYLALEKLRFGDQFNYRVILQDTLDKERVHIPSMIIQPFVENAIKHGLLHKHGEKQLTIRFSLEHEVLICSITDNGIGREKAAEIKARAQRTHRSFATEATEKRLALINNTRTRKIKLEIKDLNPGTTSTGTEVIITIPV